MILFTLVVVAAIYAFSWKMRSNSLLTSFDWKGWRNPPPLQGGTWTRTRPRGVAPGWHAPRRWRVVVAAFSREEKFYEAIYEIAFTEVRPSTATPDRVAIRDYGFAAGQASDGLTWSVSARKVAER